MKTHCGLPCILILRIVLPGTCFSICDLAASVPEIQLDCNKPFRWNSRYMGEWIGPPKRSEVVNASSESFCSIQCMKNNCTVMQFLGDKDCVLTFTERRIGSLRSGFKIAGTTNVALNKPTESATPHIHYTGPLQSSYAVDGSISNPDHFFAAYVSPKTWILVDLQEKYKVKEIHAIPRQDGFIADRLVGVAFMLGNELVTNGDFSNYETVAIVNNARTETLQWVVVQNQLFGTHQYVALQRLDTIGYNSLDVAELEVYV